MDKTLDKVLNSWWPITQNLLNNQTVRLSSGNDCCLGVIRLLWTACTYTCLTFLSSHLSATDCSQSRTLFSRLYAACATFKSSSELHFLCRDRGALHECSPSHNCYGSGSVMIWDSISTALYHVAGNLNGSWIMKRFFSLQLCHSCSSSSKSGRQ